MPLDFLWFLAREGLNGAGADIWSQTPIKLVFFIYSITMSCCLVTEAGCMITARASIEKFSQLWTETGTIPLVYSLTHMKNVLVQTQEEENKSISIVNHDSILAVFLISPCSNCTMTMLPAFIFKFT